MVSRFFREVLAVSTALISFSATTEEVRALEPENWTKCLYNKKELVCRRIFLCPVGVVPCIKFRLEWNDGVKDTYTRMKSGIARNVGFYQDARGGQWTLRGYAGSFALRNNANGNTIVYDMTLKQCQKSGLSDLCSD